MPWSTPGPWTSYAPRHAEPRYHVLRTPWRSAREVSHEVSLSLSLSLFVSVAVAGCSSSPERSGEERGPLSHVHVTGQPGDITQWETQSETVLSVQTFACPAQPCVMDLDCPCSHVCLGNPGGGPGNCSTAGSQPIVTVTDNDDTTETLQTYIVYSNTDRWIYRNASLMGWQVSDNGGQSFYWGGKVRPPTGWAVLWGDPALASSRADQSYVFLSNLAVPGSKFPGVGYIEGAITTGCNGGSCLGGACVARSVDAGHTFTLSASDCLTNQSHFYDGGSIETDNNGGVYAAWVDWDASKIDVWRATSLNGSFARLPDPFPGKTIQSHPRLVFEPLNQRLYLVAQADSLSQCSPNNAQEQCVNLYVTYWDLGSQAWGPAAYVAYGLNQLYWRFGPSPPRLVRGHPQFSIASAQASVLGDDAIRIAYTAVLSNGRHVIHISRCTWGSPAPSCLPTWEWQSDAYAGDHWNPVVSAQHGFPPVATEFVLSYTTSGTSTAPYGVGWAFGELVVTSGGIRFFIPQVPYDNYVVCPDIRGYWGDYDNLDVLFAGNQPGGKSTFIRAHTDSSAAACVQETYTSSPVHVSAITWP